jgi:hypothetical protein
MTLRLALAAACCALALPGTAAALTCYTLLDRNDNVIYRDTYPPVDLSDQGTAERERMRKRGEHLIAMDADRCPNVEFFTGAAGSSGVDVDAVVNGIPVRRAGELPRVAPSTPTAPKAANGTRR